MFKPKNTKEEYALLVGDDKEFSKTTEYLLPLIDQALLSIRDEAARKFHRDNLIQMVRIATQRFLENPDNIRKEIKFSTYFTWYIHEELKKSSL